MGKNKPQVRVLYEDAHLLVVYKPEGLLSVPYEGFRGKTLLGILTEQRRKRGLVRGNNGPLAVHRLDRETSGVMIVALTQDCQKRLMNNWQSAVTERRYHALAETGSKTAAALADSGIIDTPLAKNAAHHSYAASGGRNRASQHTVSAVTHYTILNRGPQYSLFELELETGRTNQIRAHLASVGCPIAGDDVYRARTNPVNRLCLHACSITFTHPYTGETMSFQEPEPAEWLKLAEGQVKIRR